MHVEINVDDLSDGNIEALLKQHLNEMYQYSPSESIHALDSKQLRDTSMAFWSAWVNGEFAACGALKVLSSSSGEIKSMKTKDTFLRLGLASQLLNVILQEASHRNYERISLETGTHQAFKPAIELYKKFGFVECGPFGEYRQDPHSVFFTKILK
ncbi:MAG: GNAT family N-acetyltransferase [Pseudomonadota bacterium]